MRTGKTNQEDEEYEEEELVPNKQGTSTPNNTTNAKYKASAIRSKHSVTEQRRRSKINERFQILRNLMPHSDQKGDKASFLLEVIEYVQYLQVKVQKYEASSQGWSLEPKKLVPWRNSQYRPSFVDQPQTVKNCLGQASSFPGKLEDSTTAITPSVSTITQNAIDSEHCRGNASKPEERQLELANEGIPLMMPQQTNMDGMGRGDCVLDHSLQFPVCDVQSSASVLLNQQEELSIKGGTISISSVYSQGLLKNLTQALQSAGLDLTQASISVQINLGKQADKGLTSGSFLHKDNENPSSNDQSMGHRRDLAFGEDTYVDQKRLKT